MEDPKKAAYIEYLRLSHEHIREAEGLLKAMACHMEQFVMGARKLADLRESDPIPAPKPQRLHRAAEGLARALIHKLPSKVRDLLPSDVRRFGDEAELPAGLRSHEILQQADKLHDELKMRLAATIVQRREVERELEAQGASVASAASVAAAADPLPPD